MATWTLVLYFWIGASENSPIVISNFATEQACVNAATKVLNTFNMGQYLFRHNQRYFTCVSDRE